MIIISGLLDRLLWIAVEQGRVHLPHGFRGDPFLVQADPPVPESRLDVHAAVEGLGFRREEKRGVFRILQPRWVMRIPLHAYGGPDGLLAALPHKTRYNIHVAERHGVRVSVADQGSGIATLHRANLFRRFNRLAAATFWGACAKVTLAVHRTRVVFSGDFELPRPDRDDANARRETRL